MELSRMPTLIEENENLIEYLENNIGKWDFNTLEVIKTSTEPLYEIGLYLFEIAKLRELYDLD